MNGLIQGYAPVAHKALKDSISLPAFILLTTMIGFGSLAELSGFSSAQAVAATLLIWGLPGQLAMLELLTQGQGVLAIAIACSLANARFLPMVVSFLPYLRQPGTRAPALFLYAQMLSINSWAVCLKGFPLVARQWRPFYYTVFAASVMLSAVVGTILGVEAASTMPRPVVMGFVFLSPLYFALILSSAVGASVRLSLVLGCLLAPLTHAYFPSVDLLLTGLLAGTAGFVLARYPGIKAWLS